MYDDLPPTSGSSRIGEAVPRSVWWAVSLEQFLLQFDILDFLFSFSLGTKNNLW